ncbi:MAG: hypothetical protein ACE5JI_19705, partial [Acidobacteriota bacterium]
ESVTFSRVQRTKELFQQCPGVCDEKDIRFLQYQHEVSGVAFDTVDRDPVSGSIKVIRPFQSRSAKER